jgi:hypothetical protein
LLRVSRMTAVCVRAARGSGRGNRRVMRQFPSRRMPSSRRSASTATPRRPA